MSRLKFQSAQQIEEISYRQNDSKEKRTNSSTQLYLGTMTFY